MASFQAKKVWKRTRKSENKTCISVPFRSYPKGNIKFQKQRKKNTIVALFQAKIGWKRSRKRENKNYRSVPYQPNA